MRQPIGSLQRYPGLEARSRGMALITVLWVTLLISLLVAGALSTARMEAKIASSQKHIFMAELAIDNALEQLKHQIGKGQTRFLADLSAFQTAGNNFNIKLERLLDEGNLVDINITSTDILSDVFVQLGVELSKAEGLSERLADWRDSDDAKRNEGAETPAYLRAGQQPPGNREFFSVAELNRVLNFSDTFKECAADFFTVHGRSQGVPVNIKSPADPAIPEDAALNESSDKSHKEVGVTGRKLLFTLTAYKGEAKVASKHFVVLATGTSQNPLLVMATPHERSTRCSQSPASRSNAAHGDS